MAAGESRSRIDCTDRTHPTKIGMGGAPTIGQQSGNLRADNMKIFISHSWKDKTAARLVLLGAFGPVNAEHGWLSAGAARIGRLHC